MGNPFNYMLCGFGIKNHFEPRRMPAVHRDATRCSRCHKPSIKYLLSSCLFVLGDKMSVFLSHVFS